MDRNDDWNKLVFTQAGDGMSFLTSHMLVLGSTRNGNNQPVVSVIDKGESCRGMVERLQGRVKQAEPYYRQFAKRRF